MNNLDIFLAVLTAASVKAGTPIWVLYSLMQSSSPFPGLPDTDSSVAVSLAGVPKEHPNNIANNNTI